MNTPYEKYRETLNWKIISAAISDLVENQDIEELTHRDYIVGYLCKELAKKNK